MTSDPCGIKGQRKRGEGGALPLHKGVCFTNLQSFCSSPSFIRLYYHGNGGARLKKKNQ